jgi:phosphate transport system substrate-binding protein
MQTTTTTRAIDALRRSDRLAVLPAAIVACVLAGCGGGEPSGGGEMASTLGGAVRIDGSSTVYPITEAVAEEFRETAPDVRVTIGVSGTGGGFKKFAAAEIDVSDASRPIKHAESELAGGNGVSYVELPVAYDGLTIVVHPANDWAQSLTIEQLRRVFTTDGTVSRWNELDPAWPDRAIKVYSPGTDSGTFDYFKEVMGGDRSIRSDISVSEDDNVLVRGVAGDEGAIGFFGCAYYFENEGKLRAVPVDGGKGPVAMSVASIEDGTYAPFSRPLLVYVNAKSADRPEVAAFVDFYLEHAGDLASEVGYVRLPADIYARVRANWEARRTGTQFCDADGAPRHGPLAELYR